MASLLNEAVGMVGGWYGDLPGTGRGRVLGMEGRSVCVEGILIGGGRRMVR